MWRFYQGSAAPGLDSRGELNAVLYMAVVGDDPTTQREAFRGTIPWEHSAEVTGDAIA
jgi:hypothetical protein